MTVRNRTHRQLARLACIGATLLAAPAHAGDWKVTNDIQLTTFASDNLSLREDGNAGGGLTIRPHIGLQGNGRRVRGTLSYTPTLIGYVGEDAPGNRLSHSLDAAFNSELVRQTLFLDVTASASLVNTSGLAAGNDPSYANGDQGRQTYTLSVSPYTVHRFGSYATLTLRAGLDTVQAESGASDLNSTGRDFSAVLASGTQFTRLPWSLRASQSDIEYDNNSQTSRSLKGTLGYRIDRQWRVDGSLGYEDQDVATSRSSTSGETYSGTVYWTPNPRTSAEFELGKRYFGTFWRGQAQHRSRRSLFTLDVAREVTNARTLLRRRLTEQELADFAAERPDLTDQQIELLRLFAVVPEIADGDFLDTRIGAGLVLTGRRTTVSMRSDWSRREFELSSLQDDILSFALNANRQLSAGLSANAGLTWQSVDSNTGTDSAYLRLNAGVSHTLGRYSRIGVDLSRQERTTDSGTDEYVEHRVSLTFTTRMF